MVRCHYMSTPYSLEAGPFNLLPGYPAGISGRTLPGEWEGLDLRIRGYLDPVENDATGSPVPGYPPVQKNIGHVLPHTSTIARNLNEMSPTQAAPGDDQHSKMSDTRTYNR